jgi:TusA-related sulfurtransferase
MIDYNTKLVWLNEKSIPDTIIQFMNQQEYKLIDISYLRSNYKVLVKENNMIQNLFEGII